jgi:type I restriction enzyme S subunit
MTGDLRSYPEYKDPGLPWLGKVPAHWEIKRIKTLLKEVDHRSSSGEEPLLSMTRALGLIRHTEATDKLPAASTLVGYKICHPGEVVMNRMQAWSGMFHIAPEQGLVSPDYAVFTPLNGVNSHFLGHLFRSPGMVLKFHAESKGIGSGFLRLYGDRFGAIPIAVPSPGEQDSIVNFIDRLGRRVRRFIRNRRRLIEVLNEQKQAIINRTMTRGLDPNVLLKPSGIDWLGDIPKHWNLKRLKFLVQNVNEQTSTKLSDETYIALENVNSWTGIISVPSSEVTFDSQVKRFQANDVLFGKLRPYLAKVTRPDVNGVCVGEFLVLRVTDHSVLPGFLEQKLRSKQFIELISGSTFGAKMPRAEWTFIGNVKIAYPSDISEQQKILDQIAETTLDLQTTIDHAYQEINLIREYLTRLIADVVTGKLDVRYLASGTIEAETEGLAEGMEDELPVEDTTELVKEDENDLSASNSH